MPTSRRRTARTLALGMMLVSTAWLSPSAGASSQAASVNWPQLHFSADHRGFNPHETILGPTTVGGLALHWQSLYATGYLQSPVVAGGVIYVGEYLAAEPGDENRLYALDERTGALIWQTDATQDGFAGAPAVSNGLVYAVDAYPGKLDAFDRRDGSLVWSRPIDRGSGYLAQPAVADGMVFVNGQDFPGTLYAFDALTGDLVWAAPTADSLIGAPAVAKGMVYVGGQEGTEYAFNEADGTLVWESSPTGAAGFTSAAVADGKVYVGNQDTHVYAFDAFTGATIWTYPGQYAQISYSPPAVAYGLVYVGGTNSKHFYAIEAETGRLRWQVIGGHGGYFPGAPAVANGVVYEGQQPSGQFSAYDARTGAVLWTYTVSDQTAPVVVDGSLYIASSQSVVAFGLPPRG
jgi:outer membrane protein assembly factor BamB